MTHYSRHLSTSYFSIDLIHPYNVKEFTSRDLTVSIKDDPLIGLVCLHMAEVFSLAKSDKYADTGKGVPHGCSFLVCALHYNNGSVDPEHRFYMQREIAKKNKYFLSEHPRL